MVEDASLAAMSAFSRQRAFLHQAGTYHGQGGALGGHTAPLGEPAGSPRLPPPASSLHKPGHVLHAKLHGLSITSQYPGTGFAGL